MNAIAKIKTDVSPGIHSLPHLLVSETTGLVADDQSAADGGLERIDLILKTMRTRKISMSSLHAAICLYRDQKGQMSLTGLAENLGVTTAAVTNIADTMERLGFARRRTNPLDRRLTWINLTPRGIAFVDWINLTLTCSIQPVENPTMVGHGAVSIA
jgi:DNA-binding MarR family transcriptional regulator